MTKSNRVRNLTRGFTIKRNQALAAIENCAAAWVVEGESVRDLTLAESITKRNEQARNREPLANAEIPGIIFKPCIAGQSATQRSYQLVAAANQFCAGII